MKKKLWKLIWLSAYVWNAYYFLLEDSIKCGIVMIICMMMFLNEDSKR